MDEDREGGIEKMLADIQSEAALTRALTGIRSLSGRVLRAMASVPRETYVPERDRYRAFANGPLPIGHGQTISQPFIVALMTELIRPSPTKRVLEIGTGCGYQTAVLAELCAAVFSVEVIAALSREAGARLRKAGYTNVVTRVGNGYLGWPDHAPYDGILVTAAAPQVPAALLDQLIPGGRMVIPVGMPHGTQSLRLIEKGADGRAHGRDLLAVAFVPMVDDPQTPAGADRDDG